MLNKDGLTEREFLESYDPSKWERPSVTVDVFLYCVRTNSALLIKRGNHPFMGKWALPGGFLEYNETAEEGAKRELFEETGVKINGIKQLRTFSEPNRDPRTRIVTVVFVAFTDEEYSKAGDDASDAAYFKAKKEVLEIKGGIEAGRIRLNSENEVIQYLYRKENQAAAYPSDASFTCSGAGRIAGDHAAIIACALDFIEQCTKKS
ncbi:MAG: NUDIX hydrolase [Eubacteriales bacterium]|nr:NUDIX hydrolase [Eubacteriales bacterium]